MPRELITLQVGQCGNQIGCRFWDLAVKEHKLHNASGTYDEALSRYDRIDEWYRVRHSSLDCTDEANAVFLRMLTQSLSLQSGSSAELGSSQSRISRCEAHIACHI